MNTEERKTKADIAIAYVASMCGDDLLNISKILETSFMATLLELALYSPSKEAAKKLISSFLE